MTDPERREWKRMIRRFEEKDSLAAYACWRADRAILAGRPDQARRWLGEARAHLGEVTYRACALNGHNPQRALFGPEAAQMEMAL